MKTLLLEAAVGLIVLLSALSGISNTNSQSHSSQAASSLPGTVTLYMSALTNDGALTGQPCSQTGSTSLMWGCTAYCTIGVWQGSCTNPAIHPPPVPKPSGQSAWVYPFTSNQVTVEIDGSATYNGYTYNRYLRDVVAQETHPEAFAAKAVTAQAIAARTYAYHRGGAGIIDNSAGYQVYVPFRYDSMKRNYGDFRPVIDAAVQRQVYLSPDGNANRDPIDAQYFDDRPAATLSGASANLVAVPDPVSQSSCGSYASGNGVGFSQKGASRWALGNPQYNPNNSPCAPWSVIWRNPFQILVHYYTDVDIWDRAGYPQAPDQRWNALQISNLPPAIVQPGSTHALSVFVQNTGVNAWDTSYALSYWLCRSQNDCDNLDGARRVQLTSSLLPGETRELTGLSVYFPAHWRGPATISLDMRTSSAWFSTGGWYWQDIPVCIGSCSKTYLPIQHRGYIPQNH